VTVKNIAMKSKLCIYFSK